MTVPPGRAVPDVRVRANDRPLRSSGAYVLYWMTAARRTGWNFALQHAANRAADFGKPLVVLEALRCDYPWASDRLHAFVLGGMADNAASLARSNAFYRPFVETSRDQGRGLVERLSADAALVVTDDFPCFFLPQMTDSAERRIDVRFERVDSNGIFPMRATSRVFTAAHSFRRHLQKELPEHLEHFPLDDPLAGLSLPTPDPLAADIDQRWPPVLIDPGDLAGLPIDHAVSATALPGGERAGRVRLERFLDDGLDRYPERRNHPDEDGASGLSPYLHFGHLSAHEAVARLFAIEGWTPNRLGPVTGSRSGWWGMSAAAEAFMDQIVTWREVGFNRCAHTDDYARYGSLPDWARTTLEEHRRDTRPYLYDLETLAESGSEDPIWNAAQTQLREEGRLHNYLRMLWGKRILEWTETPRQALDVMIELNNRYALDGRDPNSYSGIFWVLGRYDRAWGPERPIFGKVRYMSSANTARKLRLRGYLERYRS